VDFGTSALVLAVLAFVLEYMDATLGMGYGTILVPILLLLGMDPVQVVPAAILSQLAGNLVASAFHHKLRNADFSFNSVELHAALVLGASGIAAPLLASLAALSLPSVVVKAYICAVAVGVGLLLLSGVKLGGGMSRKKALALGVVAGFNKGFTGGGYGPLVAGGQMLLGSEARSAVAVTAVAEALTCAVAVLTYFAAGALDFSFAVPLTIGTVFSAPLAAITVKKAGSLKLRKAMGVSALVLGLACLLLST